MLSRQFTDKSCRMGTTGGRKTGPQSDPAVGIGIHTYHTMYVQYVSVYGPLARVGVQKNTYYEGFQLLVAFF